MAYTYKIVQGRKALDDLICRMKGKGEKVTWCETIGHCGEITVELIYLRSPKYEGFRDWYLMYMQHPNGQYLNVSDIRTHAYDKVRKGEV